MVEREDVQNQQASLYVLRNDLQEPPGWIGVRLLSERPGVSPWGAKVRLRLRNGRTLVQHNVTGHSVWAQHASIVHFGLGSSVAEWLEVQWPGGQLSRIGSPAPNQYHVMRPPTAPTAPSVAIAKALRSARHSFALFADWHCLFVTCLENREPRVAAAATSLVGLRSSMS